MVPLENRVGPTAHKTSMAGPMLWMVAMSASQQPRKVSAKEASLIMMTTRETYANAGKVKRLRREGGL